MAKAAKPLISLNEQHEYMTLRTPNGNFTVSYSGEKASGKLATHPTAFKKMSDFMHETKNGASFGDRMRKLMDLKVLSAIWPEWNEPQTVIGMDERVLYPKYGPGKVTKVSPKYAYVKFDNPAVGTIGIEKHMLQKLPK